MDIEKYDNAQNEISNQHKVVEIISSSLYENNKFDEGNRIYYVLNPDELVANNAVGLTPEDMINY